MSELEQSEIICGVYLNDKISLCGKPAEDYIVIEEGGQPVFLPLCSEHSQKFDGGDAFLVRAKDGDRVYAIELKSNGAQI
jgi:hypothetical protein